MDGQKIISLYIHIPFCVSKCSYCDFFSLTLKDCNNIIPREYIAALCKEIKYRLNGLQNPLIKTIYIGGGTPSLLKDFQIKEIVRAIKEYPVAPDCEFTLEVNPDDLSRDLLVCLEENGVNRLSCGLQSFSQDVLKNVHRRADSRQNYAAFELFKQFWHKKVSVDLISGLPFETEESLLAGLDFLVKEKIPHISLYSLCVEEESPLGKAIIEGRQNYDSDFSDNLWIKGRNFLLEKGYCQYEVSNFCLPGNQCLHNMTYWTHKDYLGLGAGATGTLGNFRYTNTKNIGEYIDFWLKKDLRSNEKLPQKEEILSPKDSRFEYFMMGLRTKRGVSAAEYEDIFKEKMPARIEGLLQAKCCQGSDGFYFLDQEGLLFLNTLLQTLLDII